MPDSTGWVAILPTEQSAGTAIIFGIGEFDAENRQVLTEAVAEALDAGHDAVELDLGMVTFLDAAVVRTLVTCRVAALNRGRAFRISHATGIVSDVLRATGTLHALSDSALSITLSPRDSTLSAVLEGGH